MKKIWIVSMIFISVLLLTACEQPAEFLMMDISITTDVGLEVSLDEENWKLILTNQELAAYLSEHYPTFVYEKITTTTGVEPYYNLDHEEVTSGYIKIPIYFRSETHQIVNINQLALSSPLVSFVTDVAFISHSGFIDVDESYSVTPTNAMRISFEGNLYDEQHVITYEMPKDYHFNRVLGSGGDFTGTGSGLAGMYQLYYATNQSLFPNSDNVVTAPSVTSMYQQSVLQLDQSSIYDMNYAGELMLYIWIEAYDPDAYDVIYDLASSILLSFEGATYEPTTN